MGNHRSKLPEEVRDLPRPNPKQTWEEFEYQADLDECLAGQSYVWVYEGNAYVICPTRIRKDEKGYHVDMSEKMTW